MSGRDRAAGVAARLRRAVATHGARGVVFAAAQRTLTSLEDTLNPNHVNRLDFGFTEPLPATTDPIAAVYAAEFRTVVIDLPLANMRWSRIGIALDDSNPFVRAAREYMVNSSLEYSGSLLETHYRSWHPASVAEVLGVRAVGSSVLATQPPAAVVLPWMAEAATADSAERLRRVDRWNREETRALRQEMGVEHGHKLFGPVSDDFGRLELGRYRSLVDAVRSDGFRPFGSDGYVGVQILVAGDAWAAVATGPGLHRTIVAAATGVDPVTVSVSRLPRFVHRSDVGRWPGVLSGLFTADEALDVFDRVMAGAPPDGLSAPK